MTKLDIKSYNLEQLKNELSQMGEKPFRAGQIYKWLHIDRVSSFDEMTNLSKDLRHKLDEKYEIITLKPEKVLISKILPPLPAFPGHPTDRWCRRERNRCSAPSWSRRTWYSSAYR